MARSPIPDGQLAFCSVSGMTLPRSSSQGLLTPTGNGSFSLDSRSQQRRNGLRIQFLLTLGRPFYPSSQRLFPGNDECASMSPLSVQYRRITHPSVWMQSVGNECLVAQIRRGFPYLRLQKDNLANGAALFAYTSQLWKERCELTFKNKRSHLPLRHILRKALTEIEAAAGRYPLDQLDSWKENRDKVLKWINSFSTSHLPISFNSLDPQDIQFRATLSQEASWSEAVIQEVRSAFNRATQSSNTQAPENTLITAREFISSAIEGIDYQLSPHGEVNIQSENELIVNRNTRVGSISDLPLYNSSRSDNFTTGNRHLSSVDEDGTHSRFQDEDTNEAITHLSDENSLADSPPYCTVNVASCDDPIFPVDFSTLGNEMHIRTDRPSPNTDHVRHGSALSTFLSREEQIEQSSFASPRGQDSHTDGRVYGRRDREGWRASHKPP
ncbi:hypothetical protein R1flu_008035 [Riccia fluitans]|uniref:Uncharacterized protein n=1 Tax=Riccia fluitans TaxID=41844 RepID=A0ABD1YAS4_9MARC